MQKRTAASNSKLMPPNGKPLIQRVSRRELAFNPYVWAATAGTFALLAVAVAVIAVLPLGYDRTLILPLGGYLLFVAIVFARTQPPAIDTPANHLSLAAIYVSISVAMFAFAPNGIVALTAAMFIGSLVPFRLIDRRQIAIHNLLAGVCLSAPLLAGMADLQTTLAIAALLPATWVLSACIAIVLEAAEAQSDELEQLVQRDPLTGLGNRRMLEERLQSELKRHERQRRALSVIALDLDGFKALNDYVGHAAGDRLLCHVADALRTATRDHRGIVIRQGGDEFCVILPETSAAEAAIIAEQIEHALAAIPVEGVAIASGIGVATYPADAVHRGVLLNVADDRLRDHKSHRGNRLQQLAPSGGSPQEVPEPLPREIAEESSPMSRRSIALDERIWWITGAMFALQILYLGGFAYIYDVVTPGAIVPALICAGMAVWVALSRPAPIDSKANHVLLCALVVGVLTGLTTPVGGGIFGASIFVGPLLAVRLVDRRQIAAYTICFSVMVFALGAVSVLGLLPLVTQDIGIALVTQALVTPVLAFACAVVLEAAEQQGLQLEQVARRDALTGAGNRRMLNEMLDAALSRHRLAPTGVVAIDLNGFKALNDQHGHAAGDQLLREAVGAMSHALGPSQSVIRLGGDEFCIVVEDASEASLSWTEDALRTALAEVMTPNGPLTAGVGSALYPRDASDIDELLNAADERMRETKATSRASPLRAVQ